MLAFSIFKVFKGHLERIVNAVISESDGPLPAFSSPYYIGNPALPSRSGINPFCDDKNLSNQKSNAVTVCAPLIPLLYP